MSDRKRVPIGKVCYKGNHASFRGEADFGCCGGHEYATIYVSVETDFPNPRGGETMSAEHAAVYIRRAFEAQEEILAREMAEAWGKGDRR